MPKPTAQEKRRKKIEDAERPLLFPFVHEVRENDCAARGEAEGKEGRQKEQWGDVPDGGNSVHADGVTDQDRVPHLRQRHPDAGEGGGQHGPQEHFPGKIRGKGRFRFHDSKRAVTERFSSVSAPIISSTVWANRCMASTE